MEFIGPERDFFASDKQRISVRNQAATLSMPAALQRTIAMASGE